MTDNKTFELIKSLTGVEKRECSVFINSPYHNRRDDIRSVWEQYLRAKDQPTSISRELNSMLSGCIEAFLAQRAYELAPLLSDLHLVRAFRTKNLKKSFEHVFRRAAANLNKMPRDHHYYHYLYQLEWERYAATESQVRSRENNLANVIQAFDLYAIAGKLRLACLMLSHKAVFQLKYEDVLLSAILNFLTPEMLRDTPVIAL